MPHSSTECGTSCCERSGRAHQQADATLVVWAGLCNVLVLARVPAARVLVRVGVAAALPGVRALDWARLDLHSACMLDGMRSPRNPMHPHDLMSCSFCQAKFTAPCADFLAGQRPATTTHLDALAVIEAIDSHQHWLMLEMPYLTQTLPVHAFTYQFHTVELLDCHEATIIVSPSP